MNDDYTPPAVWTWDKEIGGTFAAINRPTRDTALSFINAWTDTRQTRQPESRAYAVLNDIEQPVSVNVIDAFRNYQIRPVPWRDRAQVVPELAA